MGALSDFFRRQVLILVHPRVEEVTGKNKETGEAYIRRTQVAYMVSVDEYGEEEKMRIRLPLREGAAPYPQGLAVISGRSFDRNDWGDMELRKYGFAIEPIPAHVQQMIEKDSRAPVVSAA
jgi:hypothetical protein